MKIVIVGPPQSGKTTLLHKIIRTNNHVTFNLILDGYEGLGAILSNIPPNTNFILTTQNIVNIPDTIKNCSLILDVQTIRGV